MQDPNANTTSPSGSKDVVVPPGAVLEPGSLGIHTSDRALFKRCRRKWAWSSPVRRGLVPVGESPTPLWFGSGFHEDGIQSGLAVAEQLGGGRRPWSVENESGRIHVGPHPASALERAA